MSARAGATRWAIIGAGDIARRTIGDIRRVDEIEIVGVTSNGSASATQFAADFHIPRVFETVEDVLASADVDMVYVCTPHGSHYSISRNALMAGKHVLCEKSMTITATDSMELASLAQNRRLFIMEAMWMRFNPAIRKLVHLLASGAIGEVRSLRASFGYPFPRSDSSRFWDPANGGGALLDLGVYPLTLAHLLLGVPQEIAAHGLMLPNGVDVHETVYLGYPSGKHALVESTISEVDFPAATICGSTGYVTIDVPFFSTGTFRIHKPPFAEPEVVETPIEGNGYVPMFRAVNEAVQNGETQHSLNPMQFTIDVLTLADEIRRQLSARAGS